jgi:NADH-quinone oxidoreductase subunit N
MAAYVVMNLAAFAVILIVSKATGSHEIDDYAGLARRNPLCGAALACALLSLAGVPPFIGFFGKFLLVGAAFDPSHKELLWLGVVGLVNVLIALYYYLGVVRRVYVFEPRSPQPIAVPAGTRATLAASMLLLIAAGVAPWLLEGTVERVVAQFGR